MTTGRVCRDCGEPITEVDGFTVLEDSALCERCAQGAALALDRSRRSRWVPVAVGFAAAATARA